MGRTKPGESLIILGLRTGGRSSKHEFTRSLPSLLIAAAYEIVFCTPISQIFPGLYDVVGDAVERNLAELEEKLQQHDRKGTQAVATAHKLELVRKRRSRSYSIR